MFRLPLHVHTRAEWTELGEQLIARGIYILLNRDKNTYIGQINHIIY